MEETKQTAPEYFIAMAEAFSRREEELGVQPDGASSTELRHAAKLVEYVMRVECGGGEVGIPQLKQLMLEFAAIADKWKYPDWDELGYPAWDYLQNCVYICRTALDRAEPEGAKQRQSWVDLRALSVCLNRKMRHEELNPGLLKRVWSRLRSSRR